MNNINTLHTLYIATLTATLIMLVITIVLFFVFDIIHLTARIFGISQKKEIRKLNESNSFTNQLSARGGKSQKIKGQVFTETGNLRENRSPMELLGMGDQSGGTSGAVRMESYAPGASQETEKLAMPVSAQPIPEEDLRADAQLTTVLNMNNAQPVQNFNFMITRQILMVHTEESIEI